MAIRENVTWRETLIKIIFLLVPTLLVCYFLLWNANESYVVILKNQALRQAGFIGLGMLGAAIFYHFRFRFLPSFIILLVVLFLIYQGIDRLSSGEFDTFFFSVQFLIFAITFTAGWVIGWGFTQLRYFSIIISAVFLLLCVVLLSRQNELFSVFNKKAGVRDYAVLFGPAVLYCIYIIFTTELIYRFRNYDGPIWWALSKRLVGFTALAILLLLGVLYFQRNEIKTTLANFGGGGKGGKNSMLKKNKDNTFSLRQSTQLLGSRGRSNQLLFAAHIDHFFPGTDVPNPLYMTAFYYSRFDTATQTFERDSTMPDNDLFKPNPSAIPLFSTVTDSSVLKDALTEKFRSTVDVEVYKTALSPTAFVAPSVSFFVQPVTVEKDFRKKFKSAYRAKSYISELNSAYFVYNAQDPVIQRFQQQRFQVLRQVKNYVGIDSTFMKYYTRMPGGPAFERIRQLADSIAKGKTLPVDKVLAIRDYFLAKDANGKPIYSYTDNPGIPDIPDASRLKYFLFKSHKGYCAYYAGATLFLLRAMGLPSRISVGFLTVDRSSKNKGWYWFYADQAHAWVQVFFPGYGWLDFDTTVGNSDARQSPKPDGTPPLQPPKAYLALTGVIKSVDTTSKKAVITTNHFVFHDKEYHLKKADDLEMDLGIASIRKDSVYISLSDVHIGDSATAVSYADVFKKMHAYRGSRAVSVFERFPKPSPIDELYIKTHFQNNEKSTPPKVLTSPENTWMTIIYWTIGALVFLLLFFLLFPWLLFVYLRMRCRFAKSPSHKAYWGFRGTAYYLHMVDGQKGESTYLRYATKIDTKYQTNFSEFMTIYLKLKYDNRKLSAKESVVLEVFFSKFLKQMHRCISFRQRLKSFLHVFRSVAFLGLGDER